VPTIPTGGAHNASSDPQLLGEGRSFPIPSLISAFQLDLTTSGKVGRLDSLMRVAFFG